MFLKNHFYSRRWTELGEFRTVTQIPCLHLVFLGFILIACCFICHLLHNSPVRAAA